MRKNFLIISHTEGAFPLEQRIILENLVSNLKRIFPDCFIFVASNCEIEFQTQKYIDYVLVDKITKNDPHGMAELKLVKQSLKLLKEFNCETVFKLSYDFLIDDSNFHNLNLWESINKEFVSCYWRTNGLGIGTWIYFGKISFIENILDFDFLDMFFEWKLYQSITNKNLLENCFLYDNNQEMFGGDWSNCDLVYAAGTRLKYNYGSICTVLYLEDNLELNTFLSIQALLYQQKKPNHILFIDKRTNKIDLRTLPRYQEVFDKLAVHNISWNLLYYVDENLNLQHIIDLNHTWCWYLKYSDYLDTSILKQLYQHIINNRNIGYINQSNQLFYRNAVITPSANNTDLIDFVKQGFIETQYQNIQE